MSAQNHYQKISLSSNDLAYVYRQLYYASHEKFKTHLPGCEPGDQVLIRAQNLVCRDLENLFEKARHALVVDGEDLGERNIRINELLSVEEREEVVAFDQDLDHRLRDLIKEVEIETTEVTQLRRELPLEARAAYDVLVSTMDEQVTETIKEEAQGGEIGSRVPENELKSSKNEIKSSENEIKSSENDKKPVEVLPEAPRNETTHDNEGVSDNEAEDKENLNEHRQADSMDADSEEVSIPNSETIKSRFSESIHNLYSTKRKLSPLRSKLQRESEITDFLVDFSKKQKVEARILS